MPHLVRAGVLLAIALVVGLALRTILTPNPLLLSSTYRAENVGEWTGSSWPVRLVGASYCQDCHKDIAARWQGSRHQTVPCEDCHGATQPHVEHKASLVVDTSRDFCATCHDKKSSRPESFPQVDVSQHWGDTPCAACHNPHDPYAYRPRKVSHDIVGKENCLSCHGSNPNTTTTSATAGRPVPSDHASYGNNRCLSCHQGS